MGKRPELLSYPKVIQNVDIIAAVEPVLINMKDIVYAEITQTKIGGILRRAERPTANVLKGERHVMNSLLSNEAIVFIPANKGNTAVVLNASDYDRKVRKMI